MCFGGTQSPPELPPPPIPAPPAVKTTGKLSNPLAFGFTQGRRRRQGKRALTIAPQATETGANTPT